MNTTLWEWLADSVEGSCVDREEQREFLIIRTQPAMCNIPQVHCMRYPNIRDI